MTDREAALVTYVHALERALVAWSSGRTYLRSELDDATAAVAKARPSWLPPPPPLRPERP